MRILVAIILLFSIISCKNNKNDTKESLSDPIQEKSADSIKYKESDLDLERQQTLIIKRQDLLDKKDSKKELENLIISNSYFKEEDWYVMDFNYPLLNVKVDTRYANFNDYITKKYLDAENVERQMREEKRLCDSLGMPPQNEKRLVDYKVHSLNDRIISVLFYKENHYYGAINSAYTFETLNFDLESAKFMTYEDFFNDGSEEELHDILNSILSEKIQSGEMYYDCWEISFDDFFENKNNFVLDDNSVEYYFDDCIICPSYTGTYYIKIPLSFLQPVLRQNKKNPLL